MGSIKLRTPLDQRGNDRRPPLIGREHDQGVASRIGQINSGTSVQICHQYDGVPERASSNNLCAKATERILVLARGVCPVHGVAVHGGAVIEGQQLKPVELDRLVVSVEQRSARAQDHGAGE